MFDVSVGLRLNMPHHHTFVVFARWVRNISRNFSVVGLLPTMYME